MTEQDITGVFTEEFERRPGPGDLCVYEEKLFIRDRGNWTPLAPLNQDGPQAISFKIPDHDIVVTGPLDTILTLFSRILFQQDAKRTKDAVDLLKTAFIEGGWKSPLNIPVVPIPGSLSAVHLNGGTEFYYLSDVKPVFDWMRGITTGRTLIQLTDKSFLSIDLAAYVKVWVERDEVETIDDTVGQTDVGIVKETSEPEKQGNNPETDTGTN